MLVQARIQRADEDFSKAVHQGRVGYEFEKVGPFKPYVEGGIGLTAPDAGEDETFYALEVGSKVKITDKFSAYGKWENIMKMTPGLGKLKSNFQMQVLMMVMKL